MKNFYKITFFLLGLCLSSPIISTHATSSATYRIYFFVEDSQPITRLILNTTVTTVVFELPCDVIGDVTFNENKAFFNGGHIICSHDNLPDLFLGLGVEMPDILDAQNIYFKSHMSPAIYPANNYPLMSYEDMRFSAQAITQVKGISRLLIDGETFESAPFLFTDVHETGIYQLCETDCVFAFQVKNTSGELLATSTEVAEPAYPINTTEQTFYIGYDPSTNIAFRGIIEMVDFDPSLGQTTE